MTWTDKQEHFFQAVAHGWKPKGKQGGSKLTAVKAKELLSEAKTKALSK